MRQKKVNEVSVECKVINGRKGRSMKWKPSASKLPTDTSTCTTRGIKRKHDCKSDGSGCPPAKKIKISTPPTGENLLETRKGRLEMLRITMGKIRKIREVSCRDFNMRLHLMLKDTMYHNYTRTEIRHCRKMYFTQKNNDIPNCDDHSAPGSIDYGNVDGDNVSLEELWNNIFQSLDEFEDFAESGQSDQQGASCQEEYDEGSFCDIEDYAQEKEESCSRYNHLEAGAQSDFYHSDQGERTHTDDPEENKETCFGYSPMEEIDEGEFNNSLFYQGDEEEKEPKEGKEDSEDCISQFGSVEDELWSELFSVLD